MKSIKTKICSKCKVRKCRSKFDSDNQKIDKKYNSCKKCRSIYTKSDQAKLARYRCNRNGGRYGHAVLAAKRKNKEWNISRDAYNKISSKPCHYCMDQRPGAGIGLDRIDNSLGYTVNNVLPCCKVCNKVRNIFFTVEEMILIGNTIREIRKNRDIG